MVPVIPDSGDWGFSRYLQYPHKRSILIFRINSWQVSSSNLQVSTENQIQSFDSHPERDECLGAILIFGGGYRTVRSWEMNITDHSPQDYICVYKGPYLVQTFQLTHVVVPCRRDKMTYRPSRNVFITVSIED